MGNRRLLYIVIAIAIILLIPLIAMQFSEEVNWSLFDFIIAATLLSGTGLLCEFVLRRVKEKNYRIIICVIILAILILVWIELAIGIFGTPFAGS
ncbi:MAG TPA: hypothetical protein VI548_10700 [Chitinophagaceae bacterium]|nr:hypothetical protein [Chitinophagaceae bacterium]